MENKGQIIKSDTRKLGGAREDYVFEKDIFSNIFDKDIRRIYLFKKTERLARALHLVSPAFGQSVALRERAERLSLDLIDAAVSTGHGSRAVLARELLSLISFLGILRAGGHLSSMNAEVIGREAEQLLQEVASYEEPRLSLGEAPTLAEIAKSGAREGNQARSTSRREPAEGPARKMLKNVLYKSKGHEMANIKDSSAHSSRREHILNVLKDKPGAYIKDISTTIREVSEKTIQRELQALVEEGVVTRSGKRRWTTYALAH